jgi:hypothetical protein
MISPAGTKSILKSFYCAERKAQRRKARTSAGAIGWTAFIQIKIITLLCIQFCSDFDPYCNDPDHFCVSSPLPSNSFFIALSGF